MSAPLLRKLIQRLLDEAAQNSSDAASAGLGLIVFEDRRFVLYDTQAVVAAVKAKVDENPEDVSTSDVEDVLKSEDHVRGYMTTTAAKQGNCYGANEVQGIAAIKGFGPLLYDIALGYVPALMPDRKSVSDQAAGVWQYYVNKRADVKKLKFDDIEDPQTPPTEDDCSLHDRPELNYAIKSAGANAQQLIANHNQLVKQLVQYLEESNVFLDERDITEKLSMAGLSFFETRYSG